MITAKPKHAAVNATFAKHRLWVITGLVEDYVLAISPQLGSMDPADTPTPHPDIGKDHLVFVDGGRWRSPMAESVFAAGDGIAQFKLPYWSQGWLRIQPLTIEVAQSMKMPNVEGLTPGVPEDEDIFDSMFPR